MMHLRRLGSVVFALALLAAACGGDTTDGDDNTASGDPTPTATVTDPAVEPTSAPTEAPVPAAETAPSEPPAVEVRDIGSVVAGTTGRDQWRLAAGAWVSSAFSGPVSWTTTVDATLIREGSGFVGLEADGGVLLLVEPVEVARPAGWEAATAGIDVDALAAIDGVDVVDSGEDWVDFVIDSAAGEGWPCEYALELTCVDAFRLQGSSVPLPADRVVRMAAASVADLPLFVVTYGDDTGAGSLADAAVDIARGMVAAGGDPDPSVFLAALGNRFDRIPAGSYVAPIADSVVAFDFAEDLEGWQHVVGGFRTVGFSSTGPRASVFVLELAGLVDPDDPQPAPPEWPTLFLSQEPTTIDGVEAWLAELVAIVDSGVTEVGGQEAGWWDITVDDTVDSSPCGFERWFDPEALCVTTLVNELGYNAFSAKIVRVHYVPAADLWIQLGAQEPELPLSDVLDLAAPILDAMTINSAG